jgi:GNAT superfamily N-acetyltransferase
MAEGRHRPAAVDARVATAEDLPALAETFGLAFQDDPVWSWAFRVSAHGPRPLRRAWRFLVNSTLDYHWVWRTEECASASLWIPPGKPEMKPEDEEPFGALLEEQLGADAARVLDSFERFDRAHPHDRGRHYYLSLLATHPDHAGKGVGMGLLADNLARIDAEGAPAFLESSNPANDHRYERLGFARCGEFELGEDGPSVTQMWREPEAGL